MSRGHRVHPILYLLFIAIHGPPQTGSSDPEERGEPADWMALVLEDRKARDDFLRSSKDSPLPVPLRPGFKGLDYYPPDPRYRLVGDLQIYGQRRKIQVPTNAGSLVPMERFGRLVARLEGISFRLEVYRSLEEDELLALFKDSTSGKQTYSGGRYVRLTPLGNGSYLLDFNRAYNPYCAYSPDYVCPMPPPQNHLSLSIRAGERAFGTDLAQ